jgi:hypothetical protein
LGKKSYFDRLAQIGGSNLVSDVLFCWLYPFLAFGHKETVSVEAMPQLPDHLGSWKEFIKMKENLEHTKRH